MPKSKPFHLADILSVTTGFIFPNPNNEYPIDGVYSILDFMIGESLYTHALGRGADECRPLLLEQLPFLKSINIEDMPGNKDVAAWKAKLAELVAQYGEFHTVYPLGADDHEVIDPIDELKRMRPDLSDDQIIIVDTSQDDPIDPAGDIRWKME